MALDNRCILRKFFVCTVNWLIACRHAWGFHVHGAEGRTLDLF